MKEPPGYRDADAMRIIERAVQIDAERGHELDAPALREIAAEAGISSFALERAIEEHGAAMPTPLPWRKRHPLLVTVVAIAAALLLLALLRTVFPQP